MSEDVLSRAQHLSDQELVARVKVLAQQEREATAALVAHLAVLDERGLYLGEGCASLFSYCTQVLHLSEHAAYNRIEAARAARRFPIVLAMLASGSVNLTTVRLLAPHLTPANHSDLLAAARHMSKREVQELVAQASPLPPAPSAIRRLPMRRHDPASATMLEAADPGATSQAQAGTAPGSTAASNESGDVARPISARLCLQVSPAPISPPTRRPAVVEPLDSHRYRIQFTASTETYDKLRLAQDLLRHQIPDGDLGEIMDRALTLLVETLAKQKFAATDRPRERASSENRAQGSGSRHIPADVRRTVWLRDGGRCAFIADDGRRCVERGFLEFHHVVPYALGGAATPDNIQLRCRAHNGYEAMLDFGGTSAPVVPPIRLGSAIRGGARRAMTPSARAEPG